MAKSTKSIQSRNPVRPEKPYEGFPLFAHQTGRWAKKVRQKILFFGRWGTNTKGEIVPVDDLEASATAALAEFNRQWPYISQGRTAPPIDVGAGCTIRDLCNAFLTTKLGRVQSGELSRYSFSEYQRSTDAMMEFFGRDRRVDDLRPDDFERFRQKLAKGVGIVTLKSKINRLRVIFRYASDRQLIDRPVAYGGAFDRPSAKSLKRARNEAGERLFERDDLLRILDVLDGKPVAVEGQDKPVKLPASAAMRAMVLLGLNCGLGNTDVASLPRSAVNLDTGWITFPKPKTEVQRRVPLWPETIAALRQAIAERPTPKDEADADLCFITSRGTRYVRLQRSLKSADTEGEGTYVTINSLSRRFETILDKLGIEGRKGTGFYTLRHVFETHAGESRDQVAVDAIMGHVDGTMAGEYRERISDERLRAVVEKVRAWLWPVASTSESAAE